MTTSLLCLKIRFLDATFHGRADGSAPEWPPSPMRLFQALVGAAGRREPQGFSQAVTAALEWLEQRPAPVVVAPRARKTIGRRLSVPNNAMDVVARAWTRGSDAEDPRTHRAMKTVRPMWLHGDCVSFLWELPENAIEVAGHVEHLSILSRNVSSLGWGVDLVVGEATVMKETDVPKLAGEYWSPRASNASTGLRVPVQGSLKDLQKRHKAFVARIGPDGFTAPPPLSHYALEDYRRATDPAPRPFAVFSLIKTESPGFRAFDAARKGLTVAGMMRHVTKTAAKSSGWEEDKIARFVLGHGEIRNAQHSSAGARRFAYLPLPSIEPRGEGKHVVGRIRRVMLTTFADETDDELEWARQSLTAQELIDETTGESVALISLLPPSDTVVKQYTTRSSAWVTVTPVVLPGYDDPDHLRRKSAASGIGAEQQRKLLDRLADRIDGLIRKSIVHAGLPKPLADNVLIEWRKVGFIPGVDRADRYGIPDHLRRFASYHVRLQFLDDRADPIEIPGPLCIGAGRFFGLGLFIAETP